MKLTISPAAQKLGILASMAIFRGSSISNKSNPLEKRKKEALPAIQQIDTAAHPVLAAYRDLHRACGVLHQVPPAQYLIELAQRNGRLPNINTVVDSYNLVSALTGLSIGAHDLAQVAGDITFRLTDGSERYTPLGQTELQPVTVGEYACCDNEKIICRLDIKQCAETSVSKTTTAFLVYVQGNRATPPEYVASGLQQVVSLITEICGGTVEQ